MYEWSYGYSTVGKYEENDNYIIFYPKLSVSLLNTVNGALDLQNISGKKVVFMCSNKAYKTLIALYARETRRKYKPLELVKLKTRIENKR